MINSLGIPALLAAFLLSSAAAETHDPILSARGTAGESLESPILETGTSVPPIIGDPLQPRLYDNTEICTPTLLALKLGTNPVSTIDWFSTSGGTIHGVDLYVINGKTETLPGESLSQHLEVQFYEGTSQHSTGHSLGADGLFRTIGGPALSRIPPFFEPTTGEPGLIRVSVDYDAKTYNLVGIYEDPPGSGNVVEMQLNPANQHIGEGLGRQPITLPPGNVGMLVRLGEISVCDGGDPQAGAVLAGGGAGNEDAVHIFADSYGPDGCDPTEFPLMCPNLGWAPLQEVPCTEDADCEAVFGDGAECGIDGFCEDLLPVPCTGGDVCNLDLPHYGFALTLYTGPSEDGGGNNEIDTADVIDIAPPDPCTGGLTTVNGFIGDNDQPMGGMEVRYFDCDSDDDVDFADFACFQQCADDATTNCEIHDADVNGIVDLDDFEMFLICSEDPDLTDCVGQLHSAIDPLQDIDLFAVSDLTPGFVLSAHLVGAASPTHGPLWDPYLRLFADTGTGVEEIGLCDDFYRFNNDALMTSDVPGGVTTIYIGVSGEANSEYDPTDPESIEPIPAGQAGAYALAVALTEPECVQDGGGNTFDCYPSKHEPDDTLTAADAQGAIPISILVGAIGDGAFAELGQDVDLYRIELDGDPLPATSNTRSLIAQVVPVSANGFQSAFDLALALYDADGELIAAGDQSPHSGSPDHTRPKLASNVCGSSATECTNPSTVPGVYYLAVFATDRQAFDDDGEPVFPAPPPTILNFPHGEGAGCTELCDIRPFVGGRVNRPGERIVGREPPAPNPDPDNTSTNQCYRINLSISPNPLSIVGPDDPDEFGDPNGNDAIPLAVDIQTSDRLSNAPVSIHYLGNGPFGGAQGDVDFYRIDAQPQKILAVNVAEHLPTDNGRVRSYLALFNEDGCIVAEHDLSLERYNDELIDNISDELAATIVSPVPDDDGGTVYAMVGVDAGNLNVAENIPFDALQPGTTLASRFALGGLQPGAYAVAAALMSPTQPADGNVRMFVVPRSGIDDQHIEPFTADPTQGTCASYPPIAEVVPHTGVLVNLVEGGSFFDTCRDPIGVCVEPDGCPMGVSANPIIAYDGIDLYVSVERCIPGVSPCDVIRHPLYRVNPDLEPGDGGYIIGLGDIKGIGVSTDAVLTGLAEINGLLYALDTNSNRLRWWDKLIVPTAGNGGITVNVTTLSTEFDDVDGDLGTDGERVYVGCSLNGAGVGICVFEHDPELNELSFIDVLPDPVTNESLTRGPRLGGLDFLGTETIVASDRNGPVVEHWHVATDQVTAFELPRGFVVDRITIAGK